MAQHWGEAYYHFVVEALPRITVMLDVLQENVDIKVPVVVVYCSVSCTSYSSPTYRKTTMPVTPAGYAHAVDSPVQKP